MAIDFNGFNPNQHTQQARNKEASNQGQTQSATQGNTAAPSTAPASTGENVTLSSKAQGLSNLEQQIKSSDGVDSDKVARLKAAVDSGTYNVDADNLAQKMLSFEET